MKFKFLSFLAIFLALVASGSAQIYDGHSGGYPSSGNSSNGTATVIPGSQPGTLQLTDGAGHLAVDPTLQLATDHSLITLGPRVNVRDSLFATGWTLNGTTVASCGGVDGNTTGLADPTGANNSECAIRSAAAYAQALVANNSTPILYFPAGHYKVNVAGYTAVLYLTKGIDIEGDGKNSTVLELDAPTANLISYNGAFEPSVKKITLSGNGANTIGTLLELTNANSGDLSDFFMENHGGRGLALQGSSERVKVYNFNMQGVRWPIQTNGDTNEDYFHDCSITFDGSSNNYFYDVNAVNGVENTSVPAVPDPHALVYLDGDNMRFGNCSVKASRLMGVRLPLTTGTLDHTYFESDSSNTVTSVAGSIEHGGKLELGHTTAAITASALTIPVDDAQWQPCYYNDPATPGSNCGSYTGGMYIFPADYVYGSTAASTAAPGVLKGQYEKITMQHFSVDGNGYLRARGVSAAQTAGTGSAGLIAGFAWPAGSVIEMAPNAGYGQAEVNENHINMIHLSSQSANCSDTTLNTGNWIGNPSLLCAEIIDGYVPDGYAVQFPSVSLAPVVNMHFSHNSVYFGGGEVYGAGHVKIANNALLTIAMGNQALANPVDPALAFTTYYNNNTFVDVLPAAFAVVNDPEARYFMATDSQNFNFSHLHAAIGGAAGYSTQNIYGQSAAPCQLSGWTSGSTQPLFRSCQTNSGFTADQWSGTSWINVLTAGSAGLTTNNLTTNGLLYTVGGYRHNVVTFATASFALTSGQDEFIATPGTGTPVYTIPNPAGSGSHFTFVAQGNNPFTITTSGGSLSINGVNRGGSMTLYAPRTMSFVADQYNNWYADSYVPEIGPVTFTAGAGFGGTVTITPTTSSDVHRGAITVTSTAAGTASAVGLTLNFTNALAAAPLVCNWIPQGTATQVQASASSLAPSIPTTTSDQLLVGATAIPAGTYTFGYTCQ